MLTTVLSDIFYMQDPQSFVMKSTQLLSIVFSLIMFTGVTASGAAFAQSDELEDDLTASGDDIETEDDLTASGDDIETEDDTIEDDKDDDRDYDRDGKYYDLDDKLDRYCEMSDEDKLELISKYDKSQDHVDRMNAYCELDEDGRDAYFDEHKEKFRMQHDKNMRDMLVRYCEMSDEDKSAFLAEHNKAEDHAEKMNEYCSLDEDARMDFLEEYGMNAKPKMMRDHIDYERLCALAESDRAAEITDSEKLDRVSNWCDMTPEERDAFKKEHRDGTMDLKEKRHDALERMKENTDLSPRLREMIMEKHDISDERMDEIKEKYREKYGDITNDQRLDLQMKFKEHMATIRANMSDERQSAIHDRISEMKAFKAELRDRASDMTDEEKQELRAEFIEKAKDMQLAWISPRHQMSVGINADEIECREGFSLVIKSSNGVAMCLKADTALKMIDRGIAVPAN